MRGGKRFEKEKLDAEIVATDESEVYADSNGEVASVILCIMHMKFIVSSRWFVNYGDKPGIIMLRDNWSRNPFFNYMMRIRNRK